MSETPPGAGIFVQMSDGMRGPFGRELVMQLVDGGAISQETLVADSEIGPWIPLGRHDIAGGLFPPKPVFVLKPAEIHRVNTTDSPPVDYHEIIRMANQGYSGFQKSASGPAKPDNDVAALLQENVRANAAKEPHLVLVPHKNQRRGDYLFLIGVGNGLGVMLMIGFRHDPLLLLGVAGCMAIYTACLTWFMWMIMDRY